MDGLAPDEKKDISFQDMSYDLDILVIGNWETEYQNADAVTFIFSRFECERFRCSATAHAKESHYVDDCFYRSHSLPPQSRGERR